MIRKQFLLTISAILLSLKSIPTLAMEPKQKNRKPISLAEIQTSLEQDDAHALEELIQLKAVISSVIDDQTNLVFKSYDKKERINSAFFMKLWLHTHEFNHLGFGANQVPVFIWAIFKNKQNIVRFLLAHGTEPNLVFPHNGLSALGHAINIGYRDVVKGILEANPGLSCNLAINLASNDPNRTEVCHELIRLGANPDELSADQRQTFDALMKEEVLNCGSDSDKYLDL